MDRRDPILLVTGYPGAGKSILAAHLREISDARIIEADGLTTPSAARRDAEHQTGGEVQAVLAAVDAVNLPAVLGTGHSGAFAHAQIVSADLAVLMRTDAVDGAEARQALADLPDGHLIDRQELTRDVLARTLAHEARHEMPEIAAPRVTRWHYEGPARLRASDLDGILERRPAGLYRMSGQIRTDTGGMAVEIVGRARETREIPDPGETRLTALSPGEIATRQAIDLWFTEAVASSTHLIGDFGWR